MEEQIKASELRLNNYVNEVWWNSSTGTYENSLVIVKSINESHIRCQDDNACNFEDVEAIKLTEQWLLDFGFLEDINFGNWHLSDFKILSLGNFHCAIKDGEVFWYNDSIDDYYSSVKSLRFVHQLQNLYFCLTGKELTLKKEQ